MRGATIPETIFDFETVGRLPAPMDNVAIAIRRIESGTYVALPDTGQVLIRNTILEGHRFVVRPISSGEHLLSWGFPFGIATAELRPGDYVCNQSMLDALSVRNVSGAVLPSAPNFDDVLEAHHMEETTFRPGNADPTDSSPRTFLGYRRAGQRGVGTRNYIVVLGTSSRTASYARLLARRMQAQLVPSDAFDGVVPIAHTEGGGETPPHNAHEVLRALAGFMVHPNVAAVLAVDYGIEPINNVKLQEFMTKHGYPLHDVPHAFLTLDHGVADGLDRGEGLIRDWFMQYGKLERTPQPISGLRVALQCGGSDAFSGVSGNPLAGAMVHEIIRQGGTGVLTETDEVVGAEAYILRNVRNLETARQFLAAIEQFKEYLSWHGVSSESNPSGGNKFRGLYNIALKSIGAVHKKDPRTRLDYVTSYAEPLSAPGFYFMNGPGNDLEGIAGQVASGCNLILFVTGNGSVTNFPFVPTLKITTTSRRHQLLINEMDINAGRYLEGQSFSEMVEDGLQTMIDAISGKKTKGEKAGHSQVSIWRNWPQRDRSNLELLCKPATLSGQPIPIPRELRHDADLRASKSLNIQLFRRDQGFATERIGLVLPLSLCSSQIAKLAADRFNHSGMGRRNGVSRFVALTHTEACGSSGDPLFQLLYRSYLGYVMHPNVVAACLLEHGCEKITNDSMKHEMLNAGLDVNRFGWASVQLDGGIHKVLDKLEAWFSDRLQNTVAGTRENSGLGNLSIGMMSDVVLAKDHAEMFASIAKQCVHAGGSILVPQSDLLLANPHFAHGMGLVRNSMCSTLSYGQRPAAAGFHIVDSETEHWVENVTGLGANGVHMVISVIGHHLRQGHPMVPVIQIACEPFGSTLGDDVDVRLYGSGQEEEDKIWDKIRFIAQGDESTIANATELVDFQFTRGVMGVTS